MQRTETIQGVLFPEFFVIYKKKNNFFISFRAREFQYWLKVCIEKKKREKNLSINETKNTTR